MSYQTTEINQRFEIKGREFQAETRNEGIAGTSYIVRCVPTGKSYLAIATYTNVAGFYKMLGGRGLTTYRFRGNEIILTDRGGALRLATDADFAAALAERKAVKTMAQVMGQAVAA